MTASQSKEELDFITKPRQMQLKMHQEKIAAGKQNQEEEGKQEQPRITTRGRQAKT